MRQVRSLGRARGAEVRAETLAGLGGPYRRQLFEILGFVPRSPISRYCDGGRPVYVHECGDRARQTKRPAGGTSAAAGASVPRVSAGSEARGCVGKESGAPGWAPPGPRSPANPAPGGTRSAGSPGPFVTPKPAATRRIAALGVARSLFPPARVWRSRGAAQTGAAEPGFPKRCPGSLGNRTRGGGALLCVVRAVLRERTAAAQAPRVANQTKSKRKSARVCRLATHGSQDPRCTPFFGGKGGGRGREGGAGEGSYLRFNCRWRLRLFQDRQSAPKNYTHTKEK